MIRELIEKQRSICQARKAKRLAEQAERIYQIREMNGQLWLTYDGCPVIPSTMLKTDIVATLNVIRNLYVERNTPKK